MRWFPLFLDLRTRKVVFIGGGGIAERKIDLFETAGPHITIISPTLTPALQQRVHEGRYSWLARGFEEADVIGASVVVAATNDGAVNRAVAHAATARGIPVNVVDDLELSTGILPAIVDRSPLVIAVSTEGSAPAFARHVRARIEAAIDESFGELAAFLRTVRGRIKARFPDLGLRRRFYAALLDGAVPDAFRRRRPVEAAAAFERALGAGVSTGGRVDLVGAGPGDPGLLTLNALRALQAADVVLHDRLVSAEVLALARREATLIPVGKAAGHHSVPQDEINALLVAHARAGRELLHLARMEVYEPHDERTAVVLDRAHELPPRAETDRAVGHHAFDLDPLFLVGIFRRFALNRSARHLWLLYPTGHLIPNNRVRFDFLQHVGVDQPADLDHRRGGGRGPADARGAALEHPVKTAPEAGILGVGSAVLPEDHQLAVPRRHRARRQLRAAPLLAAARLRAVARPPQFSSPSAQRMPLRMCFCTIRAVAGGL